MKKNTLSVIAIFAVTLLALAALTSCSAITGGVTGSGTVVTQEYDFTDFDQVSLSQAFQGTITQGDAYRVEVRVDDNLVDSLMVEQEGNRLNVGLGPSTIVRRATLEVDITMPSLTALEVSGASQAQLTGFTFNDTFSGEASGAGRIHGDVVAQDLELVASGASNISLAGTADNVSANASGASTIDLEELTALDAQTVASGASNITVNIDGLLDADASGASNIYYLGEPTMGDIEESGGSDVTSR